MNTMYLKTSIGEIKRTIHEERTKSANPLTYSSLNRSIITINSTFRKNWLNEKYPEVEVCAEILDGDFPLPVLSVCGRGTREIRYTQYLAYLLNPQNPHGLGANYLYAVFHNLFERECIKYEDLISATAMAEVRLDVETIYTLDTGSTCDVVIEFNEIVIFIEQKILAPENMDLNSNMPQLKRYSKAITLNPKYDNKRIFKFYLTPTGKESTDVDWIPISHKELITVGLEMIQNKSFSKTARQNLTRYLLDIAVGPYLGTESELKKLKETSDKIVQFIKTTPEGFPKGNYIRFHDLFTKNEMLLNVIQEEKRI